MIAFSMALTLGARQLRLSPQLTAEVKIKARPATKSLQRSRTYKVDADIAPSAKQ